MTDNFYTAFEQQYRGSRELIISRLRVYLPFIAPLSQLYPAGKTIDLGCGRGEWLELMQDSGFTSQGVDLDEGMLASCREIGLKVHTNDAIEFIKNLPDASQVVVSGFHLAEHLPFSSLQILIQEALRVLKPGGMLILETPNPENITVGTEKFYLDPTHQRPIPSQFLSFMVKHAGFIRAKVLRLQEPAELASENSLILLSVLNGVSPDYAVLAQKAGTPEIETATAAPFEIEYGLSLETLANNYDRQLKTYIQQVDARTRQADAIARQADAMARQADAMARQADAALVAIYHSSSWKVTAPMRAISSSIKNLFLRIQVLRTNVQKQSSLLLTHTLLYLNCRPRFSFLTKIGFRLFPSVKLLVLQATRVGATSSVGTHLPFIATKPSELTPRAREFYDELKQAIPSHNKRSD